MPVVLAAVAVETTLQQIIPVVLELQVKEIMVAQAKQMREQVVAVVLAL
jgi:hypothetical protein